MARVGAPPETRPFFAVDAALRVATWPDAAAHASGVPRRRALGRHCWALVLPGEPPHPAESCAHCPLVARVAKDVDAVPPCVVIPLPAPQRGGLVSVKEWRAADLAFRSEDSFDLSLLGAVVSTLSPDHAAESITNALQALCWGVGADDAEAFLVEPLRHDLLMAACLGPDRDVLQERPVFARGVGYPGTAVALGRSVMTRSIADDGRYLRLGPKKRGLRGYVCVPIPGPLGPIGSLNLAWRRGDAPLERALSLVERAAPLIGMTLGTGIASSREMVRRALDSSGATLAEQSRALLSQLTRAAGARAGTLLLQDGYRGTTLEVVSTSPVARDCARCLSDTRMCQHLAQGHSKVLFGARARWPRTCRRLPTGVSSPCCLPLLEGDGLCGTVVLDYGPSAPTPPTRDLVFLLHMAQAGAERLKLASVTAGAPVLGPELELGCFGPFELRLGGRPVARGAFARRKAVTLLQLLVLKAGAPLDKSALAEHLWPGVDDASGANRLHGVVHALRAVIEPRSQRGWNFVKNNGDLYWFDVESTHRIDLYRFRELLSQAGHAERAERPSEAVAHLEAAVELYRGELFAEERDADFCLAERAQLRERCFDAHKRLALLLRAAGEHDRAALWLQRAVGLDALREDVQQLLIEALLSAGRRKEAVGQWLDCVRILRQELGAAPLPATQRLGRLMNLSDAS